MRHRTDSEGQFERRVKTNANSIVRTEPLSVFLLENFEFHEKRNPARVCVRLSDFSLPAKEFYNDQSMLDEL